MTKTTTWAEIWEKVSELDEASLRRCPRCWSLCYEIQGTYHCSRCGEFERADADT